MTAQTHTNRETEEVRIAYQRNSWREWFLFYCHPDYVREFRKVPFSWIYVALPDNTFRSFNLQMVLAPLAAFIILKRFVVRLWFFVRQMVLQSIGSSPKQILTA